MPTFVLVLVLLSLAGCAATGAPYFPPTEPPPVAPGGCWPGWSPGPDGRCQRDPSNFGGPPINFGVQA